METIENWRIAYTEDNKPYILGDVGGTQGISTSVVERLVEGSLIVTKSKSRYQLGRPMVWEDFRTLRELFKKNK